MVAETKTASVFEEVRAARVALLETVAGVHPVVMDQPGTCGEWSIKDILAHIAGWQDWMMKVYPYRLDHGEIPENLRVTEANTDEWNRKFVEERRGHSVDKVMEELSDGMRRILTFAANLGTTRLSAPDPWPGRAESIADYLREYLAGHDREHRAQIAGALANV